MKKAFQYINIIFFTMVLLIILGGFLKPLIKPYMNNDLENRKAYQLPKFSFADFNEKKVQDSYELAYADQIPLALGMKSFCKNMNFGIEMQYINTFNKNKCKKLGDYTLVEDCLVYNYKSIESAKNAFDLGIENLNNIAKAITKQKIYVYYVESDSDIDFENDNKTSGYNYMIAKLDSKIKMSRMEINDLSDIRKYFYRTDHHWNYEGSYRGYKEIVTTLLGENEELIKPNELIEFNSILDGSEARSLGGVYYFNERFLAYDFILKEHDIYINKKKVSQIVDKNAIKKNNPQTIRYADWYGNDYGLIEYDFKQNEKENLLIISHSYDNANNELIASHFNKTYCVDLRHYKRQIGEELNIKEFVEQNQIDKIVIIGTRIYFTDDDFFVKGID